MRGVARVTDELFVAIVRDLDAEVLAGDLFDLVGLVEDDGGLLVRDDRAEVVLAQGEVGEEEVVIDDDDVRFGGLLVHLGDEAAVELRTLRSGTHLAAGVELVPGGGVGAQLDELGAVASLGFGLPLLDAAELFDLFEACEMGRFSAS
ncbi:MAG: hypothetical protein R2748_09310 [Bryobacterales bacterium]